MCNNMATTKSAAGPLKEINSKTAFCHGMTRTSTEKSEAGAKTYDVNPLSLSPLAGRGLG